jgi:hypothetical protein
MDTKAEFQKIKKRVQRVFPKAKTARTESGEFYVLNQNGGIIGIDYLIPPSKSVLDAWRVVIDIIKIHKNIERTSPERMAYESFEKKFSRISNRNKRKT